MLQFGTESGKTEPEDIIEYYVRERNMDPEDVVTQIQLAYRILAKAVDNWNKAVDKLNAIRRD